MALVRRDQIAGMNIHYKRYTLDYFLDSQVKAGIQSIEFWAGVPHYFLDAMYYGDCKILKQKVQNRGLQIKVFTPESCGYQYQFAAAKPDIFEKSFLFFSNGIKAAAELGCRIVQCNSGWGYLDEDSEEAWQRSSEMLSRLADVALKEGILLAMESLRPEETNLVYTIRDTKKMIDEINHPNLKVMIDTTAIGVAGETLQQWFDVFGQDIIHMHFIDGTPYGHLIWGDGKRNLEEDLITLQKNHYTGYLGQEITDRSYFLDPQSHDLRSMKKFEKFL